MEEIQISTEMIKMGQLLKMAGVVDKGSDVKQLMAKGGVTLNGTPITERGKKVYPGDWVEVMAKKILVKGLSQ